MYLPWAFSHARIELPFQLHNSYYSHSFRTWWMISSSLVLVSVVLLLVHNSIKEVQAKTWDMLADFDNHGANPNGTKLIIISIIFVKWTYILNKGVWLYGQGGVPYPNFFGEWHTSHPNVNGLPIPGIFCPVGKNSYCGMLNDKMRWGDR